jgi:hypothetical protein
MRQALVLAALLLASACTEKIVNTWVGHREGELYKANGTPTRTTPAATGGKVIAYDVFNSKGQKFCARTFTVADNGMITSAQTDCLF